MSALGIFGTARASFGIYNTCDDIEALIAGVAEAVRLFQVGR
jgi:cysteine desulfurase/selenocysteine lyase